VTQGATAASCEDGWYCGSNMNDTFVCYESTAGGSCAGPCWGYQSTQVLQVQGSCSCPWAKNASWN
jgi:hypothetical protein